MKKTRYPLLEKLEEAIRNNPVIVAKAAWLPKKKNIIVLWPVEAVLASKKRSIRALVIKVKNEMVLDVVIQRVRKIKVPEGN